MRISESAAFDMETRSRWCRHLAAGDSRIEMDAMPIKVQLLDCSTTEGRQVVGDFHWSRRCYRCERYCSVFSLSQRRLSIGICQWLIKPRGNIAAVGNNHVKSVAFIDCHSVFHYHRVVKIPTVEKNRVRIPRLDSLKTLDEILTVASPMLSFSFDVSLVTNNCDN